MSRPARRILAPMPIEFAAASRGKSSNDQSVQDKDESTSSTSVSTTRPALQQTTIKAPTPRQRHTTKPSAHVSMWTTLSWARHSKAKTPANSRVALAQSCSIPWVLVRTNFGLIVRGLAAAWHRSMPSTKARGLHPPRRQNSVVLWVQQSFRP